MKAHELAAALDKDSDDYKRVVVAAKFDLGDAERMQIISAASTHTFFEIPATVCLFQVAQTSRDIDLFLAWEEFGGTVWRAYGIDSRGIFLHNVEFFIERDGSQLFASRIDTQEAIGIYRGDDGLIHHDWTSLDEAEKFMVSRFINIAASIEVFSCCNVAQIEHQPPKFINSKRIAKGKVPFFTYRTLHITSDSAPKSGAPVMGTHASPRLHLRRGHIRKLPDSRRIWVRASLVGDKSKGFAAKDYRVVA